MAKPNESITPQKHYIEQLISHEYTALNKILYQAELNFFPFVPYFDEATRRWLHMKGLNYHPIVCIRNEL